MAVTNGWGQGVENDIYWGQGYSTNAIGWGSVYPFSHNGDTSIYRDESLPDGQYLLTDQSDNVLNDGTNDLFIEIL
jgi:hypothetical protein